MKPILLSNRLQALAKYVQRGSNVADVGTDHGFIPVYLAQNKTARRIVATDIKKGPLAHAQATARDYGVSNKIEFVLTDGLDGLEDTGLDTIILAGMGGETIVDILSKALWTKTENIRLILQPQTKLSELIQWLTSNGFTLADVSLTLDLGRIYTVLLVKTTGEETPNNYFQILLNKRESLLPNYIAELVYRTQREMIGLKQASSDVTHELQIKERELAMFMRIKEETDKWNVI